MTCAEFSDKFEVMLNMHNNQAIFGEGASVFDVTVDEYEKSVYLTLAVKSLVRELDNGLNISTASFEEREQVREMLDALMCTHQYQSKDALKNPSNVSSTLGNISTLFLLPENLIAIKFEKVVLTGFDTCPDRDALVVPSTHDDLWHRMENPFRGPSESRVLRLNAADNVVELISDHPIGSYVIRYLREPKPIIVTDLPDGLSIDGSSDKTECELPAFTHDLILTNAVQLAIRSKSIGRMNPKETNSKID